jgi:hypothetical protein
MLTRLAHSYAEPRRQMKRRTPAIGTRWNNPPALTRRSGPHVAAHLPAATFVDNSSCWPATVLPSPWCFIPNEKSGPDLAGAEGDGDKAGTGSCRANEQFGCARFRSRQKESPAEVCGAKASTNITSCLPRHKSRSLGGKRKLRPPRGRGTIEGDSAAATSGLITAPPQQEDTHARMVSRSHAQGRALF